ncbi:hypothetical protein E1176_17705 [Fulvivirga sp. RKSG066]|uniref:hypothetical protein n=1 Tax=Fulvivirga aurantia TaxID=2529383 RepID=UPI0012BBF0D8|nr:hypothetical protein [Fulvivirga aurantia]MTI22872.1 hypothetical protein [Fulvivirga aurantia]
MSIFPKRTVRNSVVTIHWNFNTAHLTDVHVFPYVRIGVKAPDGKITMLFEDHVLGLPESDEQPQPNAKPSLKYLNKNLPLLVIAEYLSGQHQREKLIEILQNIQSGRHYYFSYQVPEDAPLGKYTLISEVHSGGEIRHSKTAKDDFFFVEKVSVKDEEKSGEDSKAIVVNHSPEKTPVKIVSCTPTGAGKMKTHIEVFELGENEEKAISLNSPLNFLLYNEEREVLPLQQSASAYLLRNQRVLELNKNDGNTYLLKKDKEEAYKLTPGAQSLWSKSDGLLPKSKLSEEELEAFEELSSEGLIHSIDF